MHRQRAGEEQCHSRFFSNGHLHRCCAVLDHRDTGLLPSHHFAHCNDPACAAAAASPTLLGAFLGVTIAHWNTDAAASALDVMRVGRGPRAEA